MKKLEIPKINSIHFGGTWIAIACLTGILLPAVAWLFFHVFLWGLCVIGGVILLGFIIVFLIEMQQDFGKVPYYERHLKETIPFDPETQYAVIRSSICTGEQVAGFRDKKTGSFKEVMLIQNSQDLERFQKIYGIEKMEKEY